MLFLIHCRDRYFGLGLLNTAIKDYNLSFNRVASIQDGEGVSSGFSHFYQHFFLISHLHTLYCNFISHLFQLIFRWEENIGRELTKYVSIQVIGLIWLRIRIIGELLWSLHWTSWLRKPWSQWTLNIKLQMHFALLLTSFIWFFLLYDCLGVDGRTIFEWHL